MITITFSNEQKEAPEDKCRKLQPSTNLSGRFTKCQETNGQEHMHACVPKSMLNSPCIHMWCRGLFSMCHYWNKICHFHQYIRFYWAVTQVSLSGKETRCLSISAKRISVSFYVQCKKVIEHPSKFSWHVTFVLLGNSVLRWQHTIHEMLKLLCSAMNKKGEDSAAKKSQDPFGISLTFCALK